MAKAPPTQARAGSIRPSLAPSGKARRADQTAARPRPGPARERPCETRPGVRRRGVIKGEFLHEFSILAPYRHSQRLSFDGHAEPARAKLLGARHLAGAQLLGGRARHKHGGRRWRSRKPLVIEREQFDSQGPLADFIQDELSVLSGETNRGGSRERPSRQ